MGGERLIKGFGGRTRGGKDHFEDQNVDGWVILKFIFKKCGWGYALY
jgi:hypothetical protein